MFERREFEDPDFRDFGLIEHSYRLNGQTAATLEEYPEYYSIYWQVGVGITAFAERIDAIVDKLRRTRDQDDLAIHGFTAARGEMVHEDRMPPQSTTMLSIVHQFPDISFLRVDNPTLDAWITTRVPGIPLGSMNASDAGGVISRYNLAAAIAQLYVETNTAAVAMSDEQRRHLRQELADQLNPVLGRFAYVEYLNNLNEQANVKQR